MTQSARASREAGRCPLCPALARFLSFPTPSYSRPSYSIPHHHHYTPRNMIPSAQDRAPKDGQEAVQVGSNGQHSTGSGPSANATETLAGTGETGGRMAHANQQREPGMFPEQVKPGQSPSDGTSAGGEGIGRTHQS
ncbi:hypothetical protein JCM8202_002524 [Rhodotorula sphaerocarpa]